jgi:hypothetical protein
LQRDRIAHVTPVCVSRKRAIQAAAAFTLTLPDTFRFDTVKQVDDSQSVVVQSKTTIIKGKKRRTIADQRANVLEESMRADGVGVDDEETATCLSTPTPRMITDEAGWCGEVLNRVLNLSILLAFLFPYYTHL